MKILAHYHKLAISCVLCLKCIANEVHINSILPFQLPVNEVLYAVDQETLASDDTENEFIKTNKEILGASIDFMAANNFANNSKGCFLFNKSKKLIGYSLSSYLVQKQDEENNEIKHATTYKVLPHIRWQPADFEFIRGMPINSLAGIQTLKSIEFINFDAAKFAPGVWKDVADMCINGELRGISLVDSESFIGVRNGEVIEQLKGLVIHTSNVANLKIFGEAFPNLSFLCVAVSSGKDINNLFREDIIRKYFPNLKALMLGDSLWPNSEILTLAGRRDAPAIIRLNPQFIPESMNWLGVDGNLFSCDDMVRYNNFAINLRYKHGTSSMKLNVDRDIDVTYMGFGYSSGGARSMRVWEYSSLEKYWRTKLSLNSLYKNCGAAH